MSSEYATPGEEASFVPPQELPGEEQPKISVKEAMDVVKHLVTTPLPRDEDPDITATDKAIRYNANLDAKFADRDAYVACASKYIEEAVRQVHLRKLLDEGQHHAAMLYTWRSCSLAIPAIKSNDQANRLDIYEKTVEILEPHVQKLKNFMVFQKKAISSFCEEVKRLCADKTCYVSEAYLLTLGKFISLFATLDELKNIKASTKNDYSTYKRAADMLHRFHDPSSLEESRNMSMFLAMHNSILTELKLGLQGVNGSEDLMCDIVNTCVNIYENRSYLTPNEKHGCIQVMGFTLYLIDSEKVNLNRLDGRKKINLHKIDKIFKAEEVVPLYGDMMLGPFKYIEKTPNYDPLKWEKCTSEVVSGEAELMKHMSDLRQQHAQLVCELAAERDRRSPLKAFVNPKEKFVPRNKDDKYVYELALKFLQTLSSWTSKITQMFSWKLLHPTDNSIDKACPKEAEEYERAIRYNYTPEEKCALSEVLAMIKGVQKMVQGLQEEMYDSCCRHMYDQLQDLVQVQLREPLRKATKNKKEIIRSTLTAVRLIASHLAENFNPNEDPLMTKLKKDSQTGFKVPLNKKSTPPSVTQLYLVRTMLESIVDKGDKSTGRKSPRKDLDGAHVQAIETFLKNSSYWPYLLNFSKSLEQCCDLSQLWYREFYLEMTKGARIQFPIEMSMPWILTDHILETSDHRMMQFVLYPLDLYNDSAQYALNTFHRSFLYEEIEAEVNLVFDQFVYKLSEMVFKHYKVMAASIMLNKSFRTICQKNKLTIPKGPPPAKFDWLFQQRHISLLGREIDLRRVLTQRLHEVFQRSLSIAIARFESSDLTGICELEGLIACNRLTHRLLSVHLELDSFEEMLQEANTSVTAPLGRILLYLFLEVNFDFLPQWCYNGATNRFVRTVYSFVDPVDREKAPSVAHLYVWGNKTLNDCYRTIYSLYSKFVGAPHFQAMVRLLGYHEISMVIKQMMEVINNIISSQIVPLLETLKEVMPKRCKLPRYEYTSPGVLEYFQAQLTDIMNYSDLQPKVYQSLRELGNAVLFCLLLEQNLSVREVVELNLAAMFQHTIPRPFIPKKDKTEEAKKLRDERLREEIKKLDAKYKNQHVIAVISKGGNETQAEHAKSASLLTREKLCSGLSIFSKFLESLKKYLTKSTLWAGDIEGSQNLYDVVNNMEFHRLWSALQFVYCKPPMSANEFTVEMLFGEGLNWAGCTLLVLLNQQRRFQLMDYSYHLLKVHKVDQKDKDCKGVPLRKMVDRIRKFQILNDQIFTILEKYLQVSEDSTKSNGNQMEITYFEPPKMEASENGVPPVVGGEERIYQEVDQQAANMDGSTEGNMEERQYAEVGSVYIDDFEDDDAPEGPQSYV